MTTSDDHTLALLLSLLGVYRDGAAGYAVADRNLPDPEIARELARYHQQRLKLIDETERRIRELRGDPDAARTGGTAAQPEEMAAKVADAINPTEAVLSEMERAEDVAVDALRQALGERDIDGTTRKLMERHYELVQAAHDRVKQLRDRSSWAQA